MKDQELFILTTVVYCFPWAGDLAYRKHTVLGFLKLNTLRELKLHNVSWNLVSSRLNSMSKLFHHYFHFLSLFSRMWNSIEFSFSFQLWIQYSNTTNCLRTNNKISTNAIMITCRSHYINQVFATFTHREMQRNICTTSYKYFSTSVTFL